MSLPTGHQSFRASVTLAACLFLLACNREATSKQKAQEIWRGHELVVESAANGRPVDLKAFWEASLFFDELAGITVPGDHSPLIDWMPNKDTASALQPIKQWYTKNGDRLRWDEQTGEVKIAGE